MRLPWFDTRQTKVKMMIRNKLTKKEEAGLLSQSNGFFKPSRKDHQQYMLETFSSYCIVVSFLRLIKQRSRYMIDKSKMDPSKDFQRYVWMWGDRERHTNDAIKELNEFSQVCEKCVSYLPSQDNIISKAIDMAVEFERSGFMAGMRWFQQYYTNQIPPERQQGEKAIGKKTVTRRIRKSEN